MRAIHTLFVLFRSAVVLPLYAPFIMKDADCKIFPMALVMDAYAYFASSEGVVGICWTANSLIFSVIDRSFSCKNCKAIMCLVILFLRRK